jgi:hypothetical protein
MNHHHPTIAELLSSPRVGEGKEERRRKNLLSLLVLKSKRMAAAAMREGGWHTVTKGL